MHVSSACGEVAVVNEAQVLGADVDVVLGLIDEGSQYTWVAIGTRCREMRVQLSMRSVADCYNNAMCASVFATLECECSENEIHFTTRETDHDEWTRTIDPLVTNEWGGKVVSL